MTDEEKTTKLENGLAGGGEMGALMRNSFGVASLTFDGSKILLDPVGSLLQSWLTVVSLVRASRLPMLIYWEPELVGCQGRNDKFKKGQFFQFSRKPTTQS